MQKAITWIAAAALAFTASAQPLQSFHSSKISAATLTAVQNASISSRGTGNDNLHAIIKLRPRADVHSVAAETSVRIMTVTGDLATCIVPASAIDRLAAHPDVEWIDTGSEAVLMADIAREVTGVNLLHSPSSGYPVVYNGDGVLIGIIDSGFDFMHPAFRDADGNCRIIDVWDQNAFTGTAPEKYPYGAVYATPEAIRTAAHDFSQDTHGTHVAAIAASSSANYSGMAPEADVLLVSTNRSAAGIVDGVAYLLDKAKELDRPMVINLSMGTVLGFKDGSDAVASMIDALLEERKGALMAIAAGNEGHRNSTIVRTTDAEGTVIDTDLTTQTHMRENIFVGAQDAKAFSVALTLMDADGNSLFNAAISSDAAETASHRDIRGAADGSLVNLSPAEDADGNKRGVSVSLYAPLADGEHWHLTVTGPQGRYIAGCDYGTMAEGTQASTIASTACGHHPVAVGAYVSRDKFTNLDGQNVESGWTLNERYPLSGEGPTLDGRTKPDVMAPGAYVVSAINNYASQFSVQRSDLVFTEADTQISGRTNYWGVMSGTSMATPVVSGIMALWLQADPALTHGKVHDIIAAAGNRIDAKAGIDALTSGLTDRALAPAAVSYAYDAATRTLHLLSDNVEAVEIYAIDGRKIGNFRKPDSQIRVPAVSLLIVRILTPTHCEVVKLP